MMWDLHGRFGVFHTVHLLSWRELKYPAEFKWRVV